MYHWLLGGSTPVLEGASWTVKTSLFAPFSKKGSATDNERTLTLGSFGTFAPKSLSAPLSRTSRTTRMPGTAQAVGSGPLNGSKSLQYGPSPTLLFAVT